MRYYHSSCRLCSGYSMIDKLATSQSARRQYLRTMLDILCSDIGVRPSGSVQYDQSVSIISKEMEKALPIVELDRFGFIAWKMIGEPEFKCGSKNIETFPDYGSVSTPKGGVRGVLKKIDYDNKVYEIIDKSGAPVANVALSQFGRATPFSVLFRENLNISLPIFNLGRREERLLDNSEKNKVSVYGYVKSEFYPHAESASIIGTLPGDRPEEILLLSHADTQYNTPGANDNTATLITMMMLAHAFKERACNYTLTFAATGGEEIGLLGSRQYAETRKKRNDIDRIKYCLNLDSLTYGPDFVITSNDQELVNLISGIYKELKIEGKPRFNHIGPLWDAEPFYNAGARTMYINSRGYDDEILPLWHRPEDLSNTVRPELVENAFKILSKLIQYIQEL